MQLTKLAVILNGPPEVGKDTLSARLVQLIPSCREMRFKDYLVSEVLSIYDMTLEEWTSNYSNREWKETPNDKLDGMSPRQALIHVSEDKIKPERGKDYFGRMALIDMLSSDHEVYVFSDGGFIDEINALECDEVRVYVIRLRREGYSFEEDSRDYVDYPTSCDLTLHDDMIDKAVQIIQIIINTRRTFK